MVYLDLLIADRLFFGVQNKLHCKFLFHGLVPKRHAAMISNSGFLFGLQSGMQTSRT